MKNNAWDRSQGGIFMLLCHTEDPNTMPNPRAAMSQHLSTFLVYFSVVTASSQTD